MHGPGGSGSGGGDAVDHAARDLVARALQARFRPVAETGRPIDPAVVDRAAEIADLNRVLGEFAAALTAWQVAPPIATMQRLAQYRARARHKARQVMPTLRLIEEALTARGIAWLAYKGHALQAQFDEPLSLRISGDIDILVGRGDFRLAADALQEAGCTLLPECEAAWWQHWLGEQSLIMPRRSGVPIDLHFRIQQPGCPEPRDMDRLLARRTTVRIGDFTVPTFRPVDAALNIAICIVKALARNEPAGSHVLDLAKALARGGPDFATELANEAAAQRLRRTLELALLAQGMILGDAAGSGHGTPAGAQLAWDWPAILLTPQRDSAAHIRGRSLLWALSDGGGLSRAVRFARDGLVVLAAENARRRSERLQPADPVPAI